MKRDSSRPVGPRRRQWWHGIPSRGVLLIGGCSSGGGRVEASCGQAPACHHLAHNSS